MVKYSFIICFFIISCSIKTRTLDNKTTNVPTDDYIFKNKKLFDKNILKKIDTNAIYIEKFYIGYDNKLWTSENGSNSYIDGYKFYSNGCLNSFILPKNDTLSNKLLDPNLEGHRGVFYLDKEKIKLDLFTITGYFFKREYGIITYNIQVKGDTLFLERKDTESRHIYLKKKLPKEFLIYKPDW